MQPPRVESRLSALEALTSLHTAHIKELASDAAESLRDLKQDIKHLSEDMSASFKQSAEYQVEQEQKLEARLDTIEATLSGHGELLKNLSEASKNHDVLLRQILAKFP